MDRKLQYVILILTVITVIITAQDYMSGTRTFGGGDIQYTHYNNYKIFAESHFHLIENKDLYVPHPDDHWDLFKYSPTFALLMAPFAYLPDWLGGFFWNWINGFIALFALWKLPFKSDRIKLFACGFILMELITSMQNNQSNALITGLLVLSYLLLERKQVALASLLIVTTVFIKLFGLVAFVMFLFHPNKLKAAYYSLGWIALFAVLPLLVVSPAQLSFLYQSWFDLLSNDQSVSIGLSVAGWLHNWFQFDPPKLLVVLLGVVIFCLPLIKFKSYHDPKFRLFYLASLLIWIVIFNHRAESPTYILAATGVAIWYFSQKRKIENTVLVVLTFILTILSPTEFFPTVIRQSYIVPYVLKAVPCIFVWLKIMMDLALMESRIENRINPD